MNSKFSSFDLGDGRKVSFPANPLTATFGNGTTWYEREYTESGDEEEYAEEEDAEEDNRLASLEALRYALHHAPFCKNMHTLMSIPNEEYYEMQGIPTKCAIRVEQLYYGNILDDVNIEVPKGKIYALLGSSNNGKSILLKCIVGRLKPCSGSIETFGSQPASTPLSAICVGYMPQEMALHPELTIEQTLLHYGRLYQLPIYMVMERINFLYRIFNLPDQNLQIRELNAGQKWRMSLAVAMIHSPPLLLLDEPTVNVDPLIRSSVWRRLERLCDEEGLTILMTTKYPEEIGFAYKVGLMRNGHVYMEDSPEELRRYFRCSTYDQLYTKFCMSNTPRRVRPSIAPLTWGLGAPRLSLDNSTSVTSAESNQNTIGRQRLQKPHHDSTRSMFPLLETIGSSGDLDRSSYGDRDSRRSSVFELNEKPNLPMAEWPICENRRTAYLSRFLNLDFKRLFALVMKNIYVIFGNSLLIIVFYFIFPALQTVFVCYIFGRTTSNLPVSVVSDLATFNRSFTDQLMNHVLDPGVFRHNNSRYQTLDDSIAEVRSGRSWAAIAPWSIFESVNADNSSQVNSSEAMDCAQLVQLAQVSPVPIVGLRLFADNSNYLIHEQMVYSLVSWLKSFLQSDNVNKLLPACPELASMAQKQYSTIDIEEVIYGSTRFTFLEFLLPGFLVCLVFAYSLVLTAYLFIKEELSGLQDRCLATGTSGIEILSSYFISQMKIFILQETLLLLIVLRLFGLPSRGPLYALWLLLSLQGVVGISFGLFIAVICPAPIGAALFTSGIVIPAFFMSGVIWPIESMSRVTRNFSHLLPLTLPINALRYIISRGPDIHYNRIVLGFTVSSLYIIVLLLFTIVIFKYKTAS